MSLPVAPLALSGEVRAELERLAHSGVTAACGSGPGLWPA